MAGSDSRDVILQCDACETSLPSAESLGMALTLAREVDWRTIWIGKLQLVLCRDCAAEMALKIGEKT